MTMKKALAGMLVALFVSGCTTENSKGECVGILDHKAPGTKYEFSVWNVVLGLVFSETIIVPIYVVGKALECPRE